MEKDAGTGAASAAPELRVVIVGNSYIYFNDLPEILARLLPGLVYEQVTVGGQSFEGHLQDPRVQYMITGEGEPPKTTIRRSLPSQRSFFDDGEGWDVLILQDHSCHMGGATSASSGKNVRDSSLVAIDTFASLIHKAASKMKRKPRVLLFAGWAHQHGSAYDVFKADYPDFETMHKRNGEGLGLYLDRLRSALGDTIPVDALRVGDAFASVREDDPQLFDALYVPDTLHPSRAGSYMAAWVMLRRLCEGTALAVEREYIPGDDETRLLCDARKEPPWEASDKFLLNCWPDTPLVCIDEQMSKRLRLYGLRASEL